MGKTRFMAVVLFAIFMLGPCESMALHELFKSIDVDADGKVSVKEFSDDMKKHAFEEMDTDSDKMISAEEWERAAIADKNNGIELFESMDRDRDRGINFLEFADYAERNSNIEEAFMGLDADRNNSLSPDELTLRPLFKLITFRF